MQRQPFLALFSRHNLITTRRIAEREIRTRVVGTSLGLAHYFITPLFYLAVYTYLFSAVFVSRWTGGGEGFGDFALRIYAGLILFQFFADVVGRAPRLMLENPSYVTKIAFPLEILVPAAIAASLFATAVNYAMLLLAYFVLVGWPPPSVLALPVIWPALALFVAGLSWMLAALGVYLRDLGQLVSTILPALIFLTPIFYPLASVPQALRVVLLANPLAWFVEATRGALIDGIWPGLVLLSGLWMVGLGTALAGHWLFQRTKHGFADVV